MLRENSEEDLLTRAPKSNKNAPPPRKPPATKPRGPTTNRNAINPRNQPPGKTQISTTSDRDPNHLNDHVKIQFTDVFGEPERTHSFGFVYKCSSIFYGCCGSCLYKLYSFFCGVWHAIFLGCQVAPPIFMNIWICTPFLNICKLILGGWCKSCVILCTKCCISPCTRTFAHFFSRIRITSGVASPLPSTVKKIGKQQRPQNPSPRKNAAAPAAVKQPGKLPPLSPRKVAPTTAVKGSTDKQKVANSMGRSINMFN